MQKIKFSVITPTYNRADTGLLYDTIRSLQKQYKGDFEYEHIFIDDGSTDETEELITGYAKKDPRIKYIKTQNQGTPKAIRRGIKEATGDFVVILGDDDVFPPKSLYYRTEYIKAHPEIDWFYGKTQWVDGNLKPVKTWTQSEEVTEHQYERMLANNFIQGGTTTIKRSLYEKIVWPEWLRKSDDYYVALELLRPENGYKLGYLDKTLYYYRRHQRGIGMQSYRSLKDKKAREERYELDHRIRRLHPDGLAFLAIELNKALKEIEQLRWQVEQNKAYKEGFLEKEKMLDQILASKSWKLAERLRKARGVLQNEK
jgi:glycosyltransferase involved in cell wall biosynthesis